MREIIKQVCAEMGVTIINGALSRDHVHMFLSLSSSKSTAKFPKSKAHQPVIENTRVAVHESRPKCGIFQQPQKGVHIWIVGDEGIIPNLFWIADNHGFKRPAPNDFPATTPQDGLAKPAVLFVGSSPTPAGTALRVTFRIFSPFLISYQVEHVNCRAARQ